MKFVLLLIGLLLIIPVRNALQRGSISVPAFWFSIGLLCFLMPGFPELGIAIVSWSMFPAHTKGIDITIVDLAMVAYFLTLPRATSKLPFAKAMMFYFVCVLASVFQAALPQPPLFYAWQLLRIFFVYMVVARACADPRVAPALMKGLAFGLLIEGGMVVYQRLLEHDLQPNGTFAHQNYLGFVSNLAFIPILALNFANRVPLLFRSSFLAGGLIAVFTSSRATLGLGVIGAVLVFCYSLACGPVRGSMKFALIALIVAIPLIPLALSSLDMRARQFDPYSDYDERAAFKNAAAMMVQDHPLGVGANTFVIVANTQGYYDRAEIAYNNRSAHVHNLYYLTAAEVGYPGLLALMLMLLQPLILAFRRSWLHRGQEEGIFLGGLGIALLVAYVHSMYEWILITQFAQYFVAVIFGLIAGISGRLPTDLPQQNKSLN